MAGFPLIPGEPEPRYKFAKGFLSAVASQPLQDGYALGYFNETYQGMSGGPVLDQEGRLIGIHGRSMTPYFRNRGVMPLANIKLGMNMAVPINSFLNSVHQLDSDLNFKNRSAPPKSSQGLTADDYLLKGIQKAISKDHSQSSPLSEQETLVVKKLISDALQDVNHAIQLSPNYEAAHVVKGFMQFGLGNFQESMSDLTKSIELNPNSSVSYLLRGFLRYAFLDLGAEQDFAEVVRLDPENIAGYKRLFEFNVRKNNFVQALEIIDLLVSFDTKRVNTDYYFRRAAIRQVMGDIQGTVEDMNIVRTFAEQGNAKAQRQLALMYAYGSGTPRDLQQASYWHQKATEQGEPEVENDVGALIMYLTNW